MASAPVATGQVRSYRIRGGSTILCRVAYPTGEKSLWGPVWCVVWTDKSGGEIGFEWGEEIVQSGALEPILSSGYRARCPK